jgi:UDP-N-acetylglucosamine transferase subunit ALG13
LIFLSLGTHEQPFDRALDLVERLAEDHRILVQHGFTPARASAPSIQWRDFLSYHDLTAAMRNASTVVCHAGVGAIMTAFSVGQTPVVIPRLRRFHEHVDDHQRELAEAFSLRGLVVPLFPGNDLDVAISAVRHERPSSKSRGSSLATAVALAARA